MARISLSSALSKRAVRAVLAVATLAVVSVLGTSGASASVIRPQDSNKYSCSGSAPEICTGINYTGVHVDTVDVQVKLSSYSEVVYQTTGPYGYDTETPEGDYAGGPGWVTQAHFEVDRTEFSGAQFCGLAHYGSNYASEVEACVDVP
jgi:hypothetical protein